MEFDRGALKSKVIQQPGWIAGNFKEGTMTDDNEKIESKQPRRESPIFTIWVHTGYVVLILSMIAWMVYMEFFM